MSKDATVDASKMNLYYFSGLGYNTQAESDLKALKKDQAALQELLSKISGDVSTEEKVAQIAKMIVIVLWLQEASKYKSESGPVALDDLQGRINELFESRNEYWKSNQAIHEWGNK
ncbi:hypothetical protein [Candidatus Neptunochlamydia vexilliferae]|uniref:Uncharacterized protein n=1 Tax=Candidatus Neptunichlamydia vexilliferae TaxID=1651774 RepID=A0ABS0B090_9BACT|nr:hypothetical protein [Candidatus Neptunochlamydia vexilliferae]MBF5059808.1 hypothetical protein [Candidatus Neptunochlamydia vexilliferae]